MARSQARSLDLDLLLDEPVDWRYKSFPAGPSVPIRSVRARGWNVLGGEFMLPVMVLKDSAMTPSSSWRTTAATTISSSLHMERPRCRPSC